MDADKVFKALGDPSRRRLLDLVRKFAPQMLTYSVRGLAWDAIDPSLQAFERMPPA